MQCKKCGESFKMSVVIDGKKRNLCKRKYCLKCSPFGEHNTTRLELEAIDKVRMCVICGKKIFRKNEKGAKCWTCTNRKSREKKINKIKAIVGDSCWICGYNKCWSALDFHHINPEEKNFSLTTRELQYDWNRVLSEVKKCALLCCLCHREYHHGLISDDIIKSVYIKHWSSSSEVEQGTTT